jgi:hypothetical protein
VKTDRKLARPLEDIDSDYRAFGLTRKAGAISRNRALQSRTRNLVRLGATVLPGGSLAPHITHQEFARTNAEFQVACENAGVKPTRRQASKWRRKFGKAWEAR